MECVNCKYFRNTTFEHQIPIKFITGSDLGVEVMNHPRMCMHPECFGTKTEKTPECGKHTYTVRVSGQGVLNRSNDCHRFEKAGFFTKYFGI